MVGQMFMKLDSYCSFQNLAEERKVGDRPEIAEVVGVQTRFLQDRGDGGSFETGGNDTGY